MITESVSDGSPRLDAVGGRESSDDFCWCDSWLLRLVISLQFQISQSRDVVVLVVVSVSIVSV